MRLCERRLSLFSMNEVDIIILADSILTMDADQSAFKDGAIAIKDGRVIAVGSAADIRERYSAGRMVGGKGKVAFPGLVNAHTHSPMVYFRGLRDDLPLKVWLEEHIWPAENRWLSPQFVGDAVQLACLEMLRAGITLYNDMYFFGEVIAGATKKIGMRAVVGAGLLDFPSRTAGTVDEYFANAENFIGSWTGDDLIVPAIAPHSPYMCCPETMVRAKGVSERLHVPFHLHLSETQWEVEEVKKRYGRTPVEHLDGIGVLDNSVIAAHCVHVSDEEIGILAKRRVGVAHCIESNLKLSSGIAPVVKMVREGVKVTFGTDGAASNNDLDILSEMSTAAKVHKAASGDPTALDARLVLLMATRWGAEVLGLGDLTGSVEEGKAADIVIADLNEPHLVPVYDLYSHIVYSMRASDVDMVLVNGKVVVDNGRLTTADETEVIQKAIEWGQKISAPGG
jgi:5-methylthioadenosine/S-adenosylhomocysteine deaminase